MDEIGDTIQEAKGDICLLLVRGEKMGGVVFEGIQDVSKGLPHTVVCIF